MAAAWSIGTSPSNLMLTPNGTVKVLDWGLARFLDGAQESDANFVTRAVMTFGTPQYMAPERTLQPDSSDVRSDLYALGATLYNLLAGSGLRRFEPGQGAAGGVGEDSPPLREARRDASGIGPHRRRLLQQEADARPATPDEAIALLRPFARGANLTRLFASARGTSPTHATSVAAESGTHPADDRPTRSRLRRMVAAGNAVAPWVVAALAVTAIL